MDHKLFRRRPILGRMLAALPGIALLGCASTKSSTLTEQRLPPSDGVSVRVWIERLDPNYRIKKIRVDSERPNVRLASFEFTAFRDRNANQSMDDGELVGSWHGSSAVPSGFLEVSAMLNWGPWGAQDASPLLGRAVVTTTTSTVESTGVLAKR